VVAFGLGGSNVAVIRGSGMEGGVAVEGLHMAVAARQHQQRRRWWRFFFDVAAAEVEVSKRQKIVICWQPAVWLTETLAGRPLDTHLSYSDMKSAGRPLVLPPSGTNAAHKGPTLGRGVRGQAS
jgi:hypothetical protein